MTDCRRVSDRGANVATELVRLYKLERHVKVLFQTAVSDRFVFTLMFSEVL